MTLVSRLGEKKAVYVALNTKAIEYKASLKGINAFFKDRVTAANNRDEGELLISYETTNAFANKVSPVDSNKFVRQLRKLQVKSISSESVYMVDYEVDLGPVNGKEERAAIFVYREGNWLLVSDVKQ